MKFFEMEDWNGVKLSNSQIAEFVQTVVTSAEQRKELMSYGVWGNTMIVACRASGEWTVYVGELNQRGKVIDSSDVPKFIPIRFGEELDEVATEKDNMFEALSDYLDSMKSSR